MIEALRDSKALWLKADGPEADVVVACRAAVARNYADMPFPPHCTEDEKRSVFDRALSALDGAIPGMEFISNEDANPRTWRFLRERFLATDSLVRARGTHGVCVSGDQSVCVMLNGQDHLRAQALVSGLRLEDACSKALRLEERLDTGADFAFHNRFGYLTASLGEVGTGLKLSVLMHLPGLAVKNRMVATSERLAATSHVIAGVFGDLRDASGHLFELSNRATLGQSEDEIQYHLRRQASELVAEERRVRGQIMEEGSRAFEDRTGRAWGVARGARLLDLAEAQDLISWLRVGRATGLIEAPPLARLNELMVTSQPAHIETAAGRDCDELTLSMKRADLFRAAFS